MRASIHDNSINLEGFKYFVGGASSVAFGAYGDKKSPIGPGKLNYLDVWDLLPAARLAEVALNRYPGERLNDLRAALASGQQILLDIDYQGAKKLRQEFPDEARLVYILPPSLQVLEERLRTRATDDLAVIEARLRKATEELRHYHLYDYLVFNRELEHAYAELEAIYLFETARFVGTEPAAKVAALARDCRREQRAALAEKVLESASPLGESAQPSS